MKDLELLDNLIVGRVEPYIYAFTTNTIPNYLKVGDTYRPVSVRLKEWQKYYPGLKKQFESTAKISDDIFFRDYSVHHFLEVDLRKKRLKSEDIDIGTHYSNEFFKDTCTDEIFKALADITDDYNKKYNKYKFYSVLTSLPTSDRYDSTGYWTPRPNQQATIDAFKIAIKNGRTNLLMYAVMRFGKSFTSMCCAKEMNDGNGARLIVIVSAKADVKDEWRKTVECADNFRDDYEFFFSRNLNENHNIIKNTLAKNDGRKNVVLFLTLQDLQGDTIKDKHQQIFGRKIDLLIIDETHFGARAEKYGQILKTPLFKGEKAFSKNNDDDNFVEISTAEEQMKHLDTKVKLHLSGTPYRILMGGEFQKDDIIAFYQFSDIVQEQEAWNNKNILCDNMKEWDNPYYGFPQMIRFAFNPNKSSMHRLEELHKSGITYAFSALFKPKSIKKKIDGSHKKYMYENEILDLLEIIDGGKEDENLLGFLNYEKIKAGMMCRHMVFVLPYCAACDAMEALIKNNVTKFKNLNQYEIINISGIDSPNAYKSPEEIKGAIKKNEAEGKKTITLTVNRMLTGSTVEEWDTMLYFKDTASPQDYDQAIFRLQNQYIKTYHDANGDSIKYNMKPQTLMVDFDPNRMFKMLEQKAQIYNVNVDDSGNSKLLERIAKELSISPIIVMNKDKIEQITAQDILKAVSEYSRNRGVAEETNDIPVDLALMNIADIWNIISRENEIGSKIGFEIKAVDGEGNDMDIPNPNNDNVQIPDDEPTSDVPNEADIDNNRNKKDPSKQFRMYYARILYFAFLTKDKVISLESILNCLDTKNNLRIFKNLGLNKLVLEALKNNMDKFMLRALDYKIQNLNQLSHETSLDPLERATVANQKFGKLGKSQVVTPAKICDDMIALLPEDFLLECIKNHKIILDIASKEAEFAIALCKRYENLGCSRDAIKDIIYSIPTSSITYEFTRKIYEVLGLNIANIAEKFNSYDLLKIKEDDSNDLDFPRINDILSQDKPFSEITIDDKIVIGGKTDMIKFGAIVGNPPYQENISTAADNSGLGKQLYPWFTIISIKLKAEYVTLITPSRWFTGDAQDKSFIKLRRFIKENNHIKSVFNYKDEKELFSNVEIKGGINYFLYKDAYKGKVDFSNCYQGNIDTQTRDLFENGMDIIINNGEDYPILNKVKNNNFSSLIDITTGRNAFGIIGKSNIVEDISSNVKSNNEAELRCKDNVIRWITPDVVLKNKDIFEKYKVFISKSAGNPNSDTKVIGYPYVGEPMSACTDSLFPIGKFDTLKEAENLAKYLKTKFLRFLASILKSSHNVTQIVYRFVPLQDFTDESDIDWNKSISEIDAQLYIKYGLTDAEINYIESKIKQVE